MEESNRVRTKSPSQASSRDGFQGSSLAYFEQGAVESQSLSGIAETHTSDIALSSTKMGKKSETTSPPPNLVATSGSTTTPNSSIGDGNQLSNIPLGPQHAETNWGVGLHAGMIPMPQQLVPIGPVDPEPDLQGSTQSMGGSYSSSQYPAAIKLLVSNNVAGSIIGRGGQTISGLQSQSCARIKLSQSGDFYPGTQDRVCLVQGQIDNVKQAARLLLERLYSLQQQYHAQQQASWQQKSNDSAAPVYSRFDFVVRILVPVSCCGMIIGKSGSNIKVMEEASGVSSIRLSPKDCTDPSLSTAERVVTLTAQTAESSLQCLNIILDSMVANQEVSRYTNMTTSYSRTNVAGSFGPMSQVNLHERSGQMMHGSIPSENITWEEEPQPHSGHNPEQGKRLSSSTDTPLNPSWEHQHVNQVLSDGQSFPPSTRQGTISRESPIQAYNPIFSDGHQSFPPDIPIMMSSPGRAGLQGSNPSPMYMMATGHPHPINQSPMPSSLSAPDLLAIQLQDSLRMGQTPSPVNVDYSHFAPQLPQPTPPGFTAQVLVPDTLIGSILGRGGRTLNELQMHSNTRIRISQRGEFVPGTRNRIVMIRGPTAQSVSLAQFLMSQRMVLPPTASFTPQGSFHPLHIQNVPSHNVYPSSLPPRENTYVSHFSEGAVSDRSSHGNEQQQPPVDDKAHP